MDWLIIKNKNKTYFKNNPISEIIIADIFEQKSLNRSESSIKYFIKLTVLVLFSFFNNLFKKKANKNNFDGIITSHLDKANDWGIMYPIVKKIDSTNYNILFVISDKCFNNHVQELSSLKNTQIFLTSNLYSFYKNGFLNFSSFYKILKKFKCDIKVLKTNKYSYSEYLYKYISFFIKSNYIFNTYGQNAKFSITLGERLFGILYQLYDIKHFVIQHGHMTKKSITTWPNYTSANNYDSLLFGESYKSKFSKVYNDTNFSSLGNPYYDNLTIKKNNKKNIVFFSATNWFVGKNTRYKNKEYIVNSTLDELIRLYKKIGNEYNIKIKLHPKESSIYYRSYSTIFGNEIEIIDNQINSFDVLKDTVIAISWSSTVLLEAVIANSLSVQLNKENFFEKQEYCLIIQSLDELSQIINSKEKIDILKKEQRRLVEKKHISNLGCAADKIVEHIIKEIF